MAVKMNRRNFIRLSATTGASVAFAGCHQDPAEKIIPLLIPPPHYVPGKPIYYATTCHECTACCGLIVKTQDGRAVKVEGNPLNPLNKGKTCALGQAAIQGLYSPARLKGPIVRIHPRQRSVDWKEGMDLFIDQLKKRVIGKRENILYIGPPDTGSARSLIKSWLASLGGGDYLALDSTPVHSLKKANEIVFAEASLPRYDLKKVQTVINFGSDFLESWLNPMELTRGFVGMHAYNKGKKGKLIHIAPFLSLTGANADDWICCDPGTEHLVAFCLARKLLYRTQPLPQVAKNNIDELLTEISSDYSKTLEPVINIALDRLVTEIKDKRCLFIAGGNTVASGNATALHVAVNILNVLCGAINQSVVFGANDQLGGDSLLKVKKVISSLAERAYSIVVINGVNPVHCLPPSLGFKKVLATVPFVVSLSPEEDETSLLAHLHLPTNHYFESWGDSFPRQGVYTLQQPVMTSVPGYESMELGNLILQLSQILNPQSYRFINFQEYVKERWRSIYKQLGITSHFDSFWKQCLQNGGFYNPYPSKVVNLQRLSPRQLRLSPTGKNKELNVITVNTNLQRTEGHSGNRYWLLETPHPLSQVAWDTWVDIHPETAGKHHIEDGNLVEISSLGRTIQATARLYYGVAKETLVFANGLGRDVMFPNYRSRKETFRGIPVLERKSTLKLITRQVGSNPLTLLPSENETMSGDYVFTTSGVKIKKLSTTSKAPLMDGRRSVRIDVNRNNALLQDRWNFVQSISLEAVSHPKPEDPEKNEQKEQGSQKNAKNFYRSQAENVAMHATSADKQMPLYFDPYKWEMVIDLDRCTGCSACIVACYAENNIAVVGKERMVQGREMSWIRMERRFAENPQTGKTETYFYPQMCAQCDNAGCEPVCPVTATYKTSDGINAMIYNRCIGSRYCANNCVFRQRRFNWRTYDYPSPLHYQLNPDVTVREKGIMEKCTFCQQRIREKLLTAKKEDRLLQESEIQTACQQTCPADAIHFGNSKEKNSKLFQLKTDQRSYTQLESLNYRPAVTYLKKVNHQNRKA